MKRHPLSPATLCTWMLLLCVHTASATASIHPSSGGVDLTERVGEALGRKLRPAERLLLRIWQRKMAKATPPCATLTLKGGRVQQVEIISLTRTEVAYKPCQEPDAPLQRASLEEVARIRDADGTLVFGKAAPVRSGDEPKLRTDRYAALSVFSYIVAILYPIIAILMVVLAIIFASISLTRFDKYPGKYKGRGLAILSLALGAGILFVYLLVFFLTN